MFRILYKAGLYVYKTYENWGSGGVIASFKGNRTVGVCRDGEVPFGFFTDDSSSQRPVLDNTARIAVGPGEYTTDVYEKEDYNPGDILYCSPDGKITNKRKTGGKVAIGIVSGFQENELTFIAVSPNLEAVVQSKVSVIRVP